MRPTNGRAKEKGLFQEPIGGGALHEETAAIIRLIVSLYVLAIEGMKRVSDGRTKC
jgi:hypothetical protein